MKNREAYIKKCIRKILFIKEVIMVNRLIKALCKLVILPGESERAGFNT